MFENKIDFSMRSLLILTIVFSLCACAKDHKYTPARPTDHSADMGLHRLDSDVIESWDFGQIKAGETIEHSFSFKNSSGRELKIIDVNTTCGCTVSRIKKDRLGVGESTSVEVAFDSKGYSGQIKQYIYLVTDDPDLPLSRFMIKGKVF